METLEQRQEIIEKLIDQSSFAETLELLREVAILKQTHLLENWQDKTTASIWARYAKVIDSALVQIDKIKD